MLRKLKGNRWELYVRIAGKPVHRILRGTPGEVQAAYADLLNQQTRAKLGQAYKSPLGKPLEEAISAYLQSIQQQGMNAQHIDAVARTLADLRAQLGKKPSTRQITREVLQGWRAWRMQTKRRKKLPSPATLNKERAHLSGFLSFCVVNDWLDANPIAGIPKARVPEPPIRSMPWAHFEAIADYLWKHRPHAALVIEVLGESGARVDEVLAAKGDDVQHTGVWTGVKKGRRRVNLAAGPWVRHAAERAGSGPLCPAPHGRTYSYEAVRDALLWACERLTLPRYTLHQIRHSRAAWNVSAGQSVRAVQELLGHRSVVTTERYFAGAKAGSFDAPPARDPNVLLHGRCSPRESLHKDAQRSEPLHGARKPKNTHVKRGKSRKSRR